MATLNTYRYNINGVISTDKTVMENMEKLATAAGSWLTYDMHEGKWALVINREANVRARFNDDNIIGSLDVQNTSLDELYNSVKVEFLSSDLKDERDFIIYEIPADERNENEPDNQLNIQLDLVSNPAQAELLGIQELKQNRLDKIISFTTDFSMIGVRAGDIISLTTDVYDWTDKEFRVTNVEEIDTSNGGIELNITAIEYDRNIYDTDDIYRYYRTTSTGIPSLGSIGIPGTPTINKVEQDSRPRVEITTTAPQGVVEQMEFWYVSGTDDTATFNLLGTESPSTGSNTFTVDDTITFDYDKLLAGDFIVKTRAVNSTTKGPFSDTTSFAYSPEQTTDRIDENTQIVTSGGTTITGSAADLINELDLLFKTDGSQYGEGGIYDTIFDIYADRTGIDIRYWPENTAFGFVNDFGNTYPVSNNLTIDANTVPQTLYGELTRVYASDVLSDAGDYPALVEVDITYNTSNLTLNSSNLTVPQNCWQYDLVCIREGVDVYSGFLGNATTDLATTVNGILTGATEFRAYHHYSSQYDTNTIKFYANVDVGTNYSLEWYRITEPLMANIHSTQIMIDFPLLANSLYHTYYTNINNT